MTTKSGWLTVTSGALYSTGHAATPNSKGYAIPQPVDTLAGFKLNAPIHPVDAHIDRMEADYSQQIYADMGW